MPTEAMEEDLLRSIEEVENRIKDIQNKVRTVLNSEKPETVKGAESGKSG